MHPDFKELLSVLNAHGVKYLVVGGYAVSLHAQPRATKAIDILIQADEPNGRSAYAALAAFGAPLTGLSPRDFSEPGSFFRMGQEPLAVDILCSIPGVDFDSAWERRVEHEVDTRTHLSAHFISAEDLVAAKTASGRPQDLADVAAIRKASGAQCR